MSGVLLSFALLPACSSPAGPGCTNVVIDWVDALQIGGTHFSDSWPNRDVEHVLGRELGRIQFTMNDNVCDLSYRMKDGDATFLAEGTPVHAVEGYDPALVVSAAGRIYEAWPQGGTFGRDQLPFTDGVERIAIFSQIDGKTEVGAIDDAAQVDAFVQAALAAPVQGETAGDWDVFLEFQLEDGLRFRRTYNSATGNMREGIRLPEPAHQIILDALR